MKTASATVIDIHQHYTR